MPSKPLIIRYWNNKPEMIKKKKMFGWDELPADRCWRCGKEDWVQKAHIHAHCFGENDHPSNLHLLCGDKSSGCHGESESYSGWALNHYYYEWFNTYSQAHWFSKIMGYYARNFENPYDVPKGDIVAQHKFENKFEKWLKNNFYDNMYENQKNQTQILEDF